MALRVPTKTADQITLISYLDDVIDFADPGCDEAIREYIGSDTPDASILPRVEGRTPTEFTIRPLSEREFGIVEDLARDVTMGADGGVAVTNNTGELNYQILRFALVEVKNLDGWVGERRRFYALDALTVEELERLIDRHTAEFLAMTVRRWSVLERKTSPLSGSSRGRKNGTKQTSGGPGLSIAKSAQSTKDTERCTDAKRPAKRRARSAPTA